MGPLAGRGLKRSRPLFCAWLLAVAIAACSAGSGPAWKQLTERAARYGFEPQSFEVKPFVLSGLLRGRPGDSRELVVYLEGDGRGVVRGRVTDDPTPSRAMGFELARWDPAPLVLYLARVGQFQPSQTGQAYQPYWANKRLAEEAVSAASRAIDKAKADSGASQIHLVGYSGGGGLALLLAQRRSDVLSLVTVAGLLDTQWWVEEKKFQPLTGSLNPARQALLLTNLPQIHFYGRDDEIIPPQMSAHFETLAPFAQFSRVELPTNHWRAWPEIWPQLLEEHLVPLRSQASADRGRL